MTSMMEAKESMAHFKGNICFFVSVNFHLSFLRSVFMVYSRMEVFFGLCFYLGAIANVNQSVVENET